MSSYFSKMYVTKICLTEAYTQSNLFDHINISVPSQVALIYDSPVAALP